MDNYYKYPRTPHLPWSLGNTDDDIFNNDISYFKNKEVIVSLKMDGECSSLYSDGHNHARSLDSSHHPSQSLLKGVHAQVRQEIPIGWRICGENLFAKHTIHYHNLDSHFLVFSIWNEKNECLSWKETEEWCSLLGLKTVPVVYQGIWDEELIRNICPEVYNNDPVEGYVVRVSDSFSYDDFNKNIAKYVKKEFRNNLEDAPDHWKNRQIIQNEFKKLLDK